MGFPAPNDETEAPLPATFSDLSFLEPETNADQRRVMGIVRTSATSAYYVDILRSRRRDGRDLKHDYFFRGLGQTLAITDDKGGVLQRTDTDKLTFADEELAAYDYLWEKHTVAPTANYKATYRLQVPGHPEAQMRDTVPAEIGALPLHTIVERQTGEAWTHPFISIIEPSNVDHPASIASVRQLLIAHAPEGSVFFDVTSNDSSRQTIFSTVKAGDLLHVGEFTFEGTYAVADRSRSSEWFFIGNGRALDSATMRVILAKSGSAFVEWAGDRVSVQLTQPAQLTLIGSRARALYSLNRTWTCKQSVADGRTAAVCELPVMSLTVLYLVANQH